MSSVIAGTATAAICLINVYSDVAAGTAVAISTTATNIVVIMHIATAIGRKTIEHAAESCRVHLLIDPSAGSKPNAMPGSSSSFPSSAYEYQNIAYCGTP